MSLNFFDTSFGFYGIVPCVASTLPLVQMASVGFKLKVYSEIESCSKAKKNGTQIVRRL
jgi:hypothetical protein